MRTLFRCVMVMLVLASLVSLRVSPVPAAGPDRYEKAVAAWFSKDYALVDGLLSAVIDDGSTDPRVYYFRGLARYVVKTNPAEADAAARGDFERGAKLEVAGFSGNAVSQSLERVQGPGRQLLESIRRAERQKKRLEGDFYDKSRGQTVVYEQARTAWFSGDAKKTHALLDSVMSDATSDPRFFYFRGLALAKLGRSDEANLDFRRGVELEVEPGSRIDVNMALEKVQGPERQLLEQQRGTVLNDLKTSDDERRRKIVARLIEERIKAGDTTAAAMAKRANPLPRDTQNKNVASVASPAGTPGSAAATTPSASSRTAPAQVAGLSFAWLSPETEAVVQIRPRDLWNSELVKPYQSAAGLVQFTEQMKAATGLSPADIDVMTIGIDGLEEMRQNAPSGPGGPGIPGVPVSPALAPEVVSEHMVMVVSLHSIFDPQFIENQTADYEKASHDGKDYYRFLKGRTKPSVYVADSKTVVLADEQALTKAISRGATFEPRPEFDFVDASRQLVIALVPKNPAGLAPPVPPNQDEKSAEGRLTQALNEGLRGVALSINLTTIVELEVRMSCVDDTYPPKLVSAGERLLEKGKESWAEMKSTPLIPSGIGTLVDGVLRGTKLTEKGNVFIVSTRATKASLEKAVADAQAALPMLMMMAATGGGAGFGPLPGSGPPLPGAPGAGPPGLGRPMPKAPKADRAAEGVQITATARISNRTEFDFAAGKEKPRAIELVLDIVGPDAAKAASAGFEEVTSAKDNAGNDLKLRPRQIGFNQGGFELINRNDFSLKHPQGGVQVIVAFEPPAQPATSIATAEGRIMLRLVDESAQVTVDGIKGLVGQDIKNAELEAAGYQLKLVEDKVKFGDSEMTQWKLQWINAMGGPLLDDVSAGGGPGIQRPEIVDASGNVIATFSGTESAQIGNSVSFAWSMTPQADKPIPDDAKLRLTINKKVTVVDVPFKVQDIAVGAGT